MYRNLTLIFLSAVLVWLWGIYPRIEAREQQKQRQIQVKVDGAVYNLPCHVVDDLLRKGILENDSKARWEGCR